MKKFFTVAKYLLMFLQYNMIKNPFIRPAYTASPRMNVAAFIQLFFQNLEKINILKCIANKTHAVR